MNDNLFERAETKSEKFTRLCNSRMQAAVSKLRQMHNLASTNYEYTDDQVDKLEKILDDEVTALINKLRGQADKPELPSL